MTRALLPRRDGYDDIRRASNERVQQLSAGGRVVNARGQHGILLRIVAKPFPHSVVVRLDGARGNLIVQPAICWWPDSAGLLGDQQETP
jgi:hypothetical protein